MSQLLIDLSKQDGWLLVFSCLVFPLSLKLSLFFLTIFLISRIIFFDFNQGGDKRSHHLLEVSLSIAIALTIYNFYLESLSDFYPVSYYDYLAILITFLVAILYPFSFGDSRKFCLALAVSPLIVFFSHSYTLDFHLRNHWGFNNPNWLGLYCAVCHPLIFVLLIEHLKIYRQGNQKNQSQSLCLTALLTMSCFLSWFMLLTSGSRSSLYTSVVMTIIMAWQFISLRKIIKQNFNKLLLKTNLKLLALLVTWLIIIFFSFRLLLGKFIFLDRFIELGNSTNIYRLKIYQCYFNLAKSKLWWGWGINKSSVICETQLKAGFGGVNHGHDFILQLWADHGLIITFLSLLGLSYFIWIPSLKFIINYKDTANIPHSTLYLGIHLSSLSLVIISLFQSGIYHYPLFPLWLGLFWGLQSIVVQN